MRYPLAALLLLALIPTAQAYQQHGARHRDNPDEATVRQHKHRHKHERHERGQQAAETPQDKGLGSDPNAPSPPPPDGEMCTQATTGETLC